MAENVALVTAGARRLGRAFCIRLSQLDYDIALHYNHSEDEARSTAVEVEKNGRKCVLIKADFNDFAQIKTLVPEVRKQLGSLTVLINNASVFKPNEIMNTTEADFDSDFMVHVKAPYFLMQEFARNGARGHVINLVDTAVVRNATDFSSYLLSKKTLYELTKMAAQQLAPNVRVNSIAPGIVIPPEKASTEFYEQQADKNLLQRRAGPADIIEAMEYLLASKQVTGQCIFVDGGDAVQC